MQKNPFVVNDTRDFGTPITWSKSRSLGHQAGKTTFICPKQHPRAYGSPHELFLHRYMTSAKFQNSTPYNKKTPSSTRSQNAHISSHARATRLSIRGYQFSTL